jgi:hypothetical protein
MRTTWRPRAATIALVAGIAFVALLLLAAAIWWRHDDRPIPLLIWLAVKGVLWSKLALKIGIATVLGVAVVGRAISTRARKRRGPDPS